MRVAIAADHAGYELKEFLAKSLAAAGHAVTDLGTHSTDPVDYPDYAAAAGRAVVSGRVERAVIVCGSGAGAAIAANKIRGIRCAQAHDTYTARQCVEHDDANVLAVGSRVIGTHLARDIIAAFMEARFSGDDRHRQRLQKIAALESE